jgi:hypothetical protein
LEENLTLEQRMDTLSTNPAPGPPIQGRDHGYAEGNIRLILWNDQYLAR